MRLPCPEPKQHRPQEHSLSLRQSRSPSHEPVKERPHLWGGAPGEVPVTNPVQHAAAQVGPSSPGPHGVPPGRHPVGLGQRPPRQQKAPSPAQAVPLA